ncbi:MAG: lipopolysaccharide transport periplasmic protein LptA [Rhodanobacteraceae bacterium]
MSTLSSRRITAHIDVLLVVAALTVCGLAQAKQSDRSQPINVTSDSMVANQDKGTATFTGNVQMNQGTFHADGAVANGYTDPNDTSQWQRVVLTGNPAHFQQVEDSGALVHGQSQTIDYKVSENIVILTGNAAVVEQGRGEFHGEKLTYNTDTGEIEGSALPGGRVHVTMQPRTKPAKSPTKKLAPAASASTNTAPPSASASASSSASRGTSPPSAASASKPAPASTTGTH